MSKKKLAVLIFGGCLIVGVVLVLVDLSESRNAVSFTLTFADRPIPDMKGYEALWLTGAGFKYDNKYSAGRVCDWFAQPVQAAGLPWLFAYDEYADIFCHSGAGNLPTETDLSPETLTNKTTALWRADEAFWRRDDLGYKPKEESPTFWAAHHLGASGGSASNLVWAGLFYDLTARFGTAEAKRRILSVSADYDWGTRFCLGYRIPTLKFEKVETGFREVYSDGIGGETIAELHVRYPGKFLGGGFFFDTARSYYMPVVLKFVLDELQKPENRGRTFHGSYTRKTSEIVTREGNMTCVTGTTCKETLQVEGREIQETTRQNNFKL